MDWVGNWWDFMVLRWDDILEETLNHLEITGIVIVIATVVAVGLGVATQPRPVLRNATLSTTSIFLTIPSLALFAMFIPIAGTGNPPAMLALFMYAIFPILRNTVTGLDSVDPAVVESAKGMGLSGMQRLVGVRLPLAWPVIMAGVRISTLVVVGIAAITVLVGGDGLGTFIQAGLTRLGFPNSRESVYTGVLFTVLLGLVLDLILALFQRLTTSRGIRV